MDSIRLIEMRHRKRVRLQDQSEKALSGKSVHLDKGMMFHTVVDQQLVMDSSDLIIPFINSFTQ